MNGKKTILVLVVSIILVSGYYLYQHGIELGFEKPELILRVSTNLTDKGTPMVNNVAFEESGVPFFYKRVDNPPNFPEIDVNARINKMNSIPASFWSSEHYTGEGTYTLRVFFIDGSEPKKGDILIMPIRIASRTGAIAYKTTTFYQWGVK